jgi:tetratricopeptide (TPR) repeat protein
MSPQELADTRYNSASAELEEIKRLLKRGDFDGARRLAEQTAAAFAAKGNELGQVWCRLYHADIAFGLGAFALAEEESVRCLESFTRLGSREGVGWACRNIQRSLCMLGNFDKSLGYGQRALEIFDLLRDPKGASVAMRWLGVCHQEQGKLETARAETIGAMRHFFYAGDTARILECIHDLSFVEAKCGHAAAALRLQKYVVNHSQSPRWAVVTVFASIGRLQAQLPPAPDLVAPLDVLVPSLLSGKIPESDPHSRVNT